MSTPLKDPLRYTFNASMLMKHLELAKSGRSPELFGVGQIFMVSAPILSKICFSNVLKG